MAATETFFEEILSGGVFINDRNMPIVVGHIEKQTIEDRKKFLLCRNAAWWVARFEEENRILPLIKEQPKEIQPDILFVLGGNLFWNKNRSTAIDSMKYAVRFPEPDRIKIFSNPDNVRAALTSEGKEIFISMFKKLGLPGQAEILKQPGTARELAKAGEIPLVIDILKKSPDIQAETLSFEKTVRELAKDKDAAKSVLDMLASKKKEEQDNVLTSYGAAVGFILAGFENTLLKMVKDRSNEVRTLIAKRITHEAVDVADARNRLIYMEHEILSRDTPKRVSEKGF